MLLMDWMMNLESQWIDREKEEVRVYVWNPNRCFLKTKKNKKVPICTVVKIDICNVQTPNSSNPTSTPKQPSPTLPNEPTKLSHLLTHTFYVPRRVNKGFVMIE